MKISGLASTLPRDRRRTGTPSKIWLASIATVAVGATSLLLAGASAASGAAPSPSLIGHLDSVSVQTGRLAIHGWAADTRTPHVSVNIHYSISSGNSGSWIAHDPRPDVGTAFPNLGPNHGFTVPAYAKPGAHSVCAWIIDPKGGPEKSLGCLGANVPADHAALGHLDSLTTAAAAHIHVRGWAFDPDVATRPSRVAVYLGGTPGHAFFAVSAAADQNRPDVGAAFPSAGSAHGFDLTIPARGGTFPVCAYAIDDYPYGAATYLGCITVTV